MTPSSPLRAPILVTGAAGFIGARFVESCAARGAPVICVDRLAHFADRHEHRGLELGPLVDRDRLLEWLGGAEAPVGAIVHLGACTDTTQRDETYLKRMNVDYSKAVWDYACAQGIPLVYASSAATYGDGQWGYDDDESHIVRLRPLNAYGRSKQEFDLWVLGQDQRGHHPPAWCGLKFFNVYGFGERHKRAMASLVLKAFDEIRRSGTMALFRSHRPGIGDGLQSRDFVCVDDVVQVLHFALELPILRGIFNVGTGQARTFLDLVRAVFSAMNKPERIAFVDTPLELRDQYQYFTEARLNRLRALGYAAPAVSLEQGVARTIERLDRATEESRD